MLNLIDKFLQWAFVVVAALMLILFGTICELTFDFLAYMQGEQIVLKKSEWHCVTQDNNECYLWKKL